MEMSMEISMVISMVITMVNDSPPDESQSVATCTLGARLCSALAIICNACLVALARGCL